MTVSIRRLTAILFVSALAALAQDRAELALKAAMDREMVDGDLKGAIDQYKKIVAGQRANRAVAAKALLRLAECQERLGAAEARKSYEQLVKEFGDQKEQAAAARARLVAMSRPIRAGVVARQLWAGEWSGAPSADGRTIAIMDLKTRGVLAHDLVTGEDRVLVKFAENEPPRSRWWAGRLAVLSADGRRIAFAHSDAGSSAREIRMSSVDNPEPRTIWKGGADGGWPVLSEFSSDGKHIALRMDVGDRQWSIGLLNVADGTVRTLKSGQGGSPGFPRLSPDNRFAAYETVTGKQALNYDIYAISIADGSETALVSHNAQDLNPVWTPDGSGIVFSSNRRGSMDLWHQALREGRPAGTPTLVKNDLPAGSLPTVLFGFSPGGSLFYSQRLVMADVFLSEFDSQGGRPQGEPKKAVDRSLGTNGWPTLSPDGRWLATFRSAGHGRHIYSTASLREVSSGIEKQLPVVLPAVASARWSADGNSLLIRAIQSGESEFYELDVRKGDVQLLLNESQLPFRIAYAPWCFAPDSQTLYFAAYEKLPAEAFRLMAVDVRTGQTREVVREEMTITQIGCSQDGKQLAYSHILDRAFTSSALKVIQVDGGRPRVILPSTAEQDAALNMMTPIQWSPDGKFVYYQGMIRKPRPTQDLIRIPVEGGPPERMGLQLEPLSAALFSRDGRLLAHRGQQEIKGELWAIENFLPKK